jgi:hypothetical protein
MPAKSLPAMASGFFGSLLCWRSAMAEANFGLVPQNIFGGGFFAQSLLDLEE